MAEIIVCFQRFHSKTILKSIFNHLTIFLFTFCYANFGDGCNQPLPVSCYHSVSRRPQRNTKKTLLFLKGGKAPLAKTLAKI